MKRVRSIAFIVAGVVLTLPRAASAATTNIVLSISGCEAAAVQADRLFDLARTELAPLSVMPSGGAQRNEALYLFVRLCQGSANGVVIALQSTGSALALRQLDLSDVVGDLRARTLAVALAELVASAPVDANPGGWNASAALEHAAMPNVSPQNAQSTQPQSTPAPPAPTPQHAPAPAVQVLTPIPRIDPPPRTKALANSLRVAAGAALREFFAPNTSLFGPWLSVAAWRLTGEAQFLTSKQDASSGNTTVGAVTLYDANLAAAFRVISLGSTIAASANLRAESGITWAKGSQYDRSKIQGMPGWATQLGLAMDLAFEASIQRNLGLELHLQGGGARGITAQALGQPLSTTQGLFVGACLGLRYRHFI